MSGYLTDAQLANMYNTCSFAAFKPTFDKHPLPANTLAPVGGTITIPCKVEAAPFPEVSMLIMLNYVLEK